MTEAARPRRVVVVDSGVDPRHPGVRGRCRLIAGPSFDDAGVCAPAGGLVDELGHGSAVTAAILRHVADVEVVAVRVFDTAVGCPFERVLHALTWVVAGAAADVVNLSFGTTSNAWRDALAPLAAAARARAMRWVAPATVAGLPVWPGCMDGVDAVIVDPNVPELLPLARSVAGRRYWFAAPTAGTAGGSGVRPSGASLATANVSGFLLQRG